MCACHGTSPSDPNEGSTFEHRLSQKRFVKKKKTKKVELVTLPASTSSSESSCEAGGLVDNVSVVILLLSLCLPLTCKIGHGKDVSEKNDLIIRNF